VAEDPGERATATRRGCLAGAASLMLSAASGAPAAAVSTPPPAPTHEVPVGCTPFRRVYLQK
jgi:hypothetical protein